MFEGGHSKSFSIFPIRVVYMPVEQGEVPATILISVSKRRFKRAVKRNRVKRQIREVYRKNKQPLLDGLQNKGQRLAIAFIYLSDELVAFRAFLKSYPYETPCSPGVRLLDVPEKSCEEGVFILTADSYLFLPGVYFAPYPSVLSVYAHLFGLCGRSNQETRSRQRTLSGCPAHSQVSSVGWFRL